MTNESERSEVHSSNGTNEESAHTSNEIARRKYRPAVPADVKRSLYAEAGNKCANPGCNSRLTQLHHIQEWHVYQTHDTKHMIAVCGTCHDHIHRIGPETLRITDEEIYRWKKASRQDVPTHAAVLPEPMRRSINLHIGPLAFEAKPTDRGIIRLSDQMGLVVHNNAGLQPQISCIFRDAAGLPLLEISRSLVIVSNDSAISFESRPGRVRVTMPATSKYVPEWIAWPMARLPEQYSWVVDGRVIALDFEAVEPGLVSICGFWQGQYQALIATREDIFIPPYGGERPTVIGSWGEGSPPVIAEPENSAAFGYFPKLSVAGIFAHTESDGRPRADPIGFVDHNLIFRFSDGSALRVNVKTQEIERRVEMPMSTILRGHVTPTDHVSNATLFARAFKETTLLDSRYTIVFRDGSRLGMPLMTEAMIRSGSMNV